MRRSASAAASNVGATSNSAATREAEKVCSIGGSVPDLRSARAVLPKREGPVGIQDLPWQEAARSAASWRRKSASAASNASCISPSEFHQFVLFSTPRYSLSVEVPCAS